MRAAICDDDFAWCERAEQIVKDYEQRSGQTLDVVCFTDGVTLLEQSEPVDVLFLDIEMGTENGIDIAARVNEVWSSCQIVYLTDYINYAIDVYSTKHVFYMLKERFAERIDEIFAKIYHELAQQEKKLCFDLIGGKMLSITPNEMLYVERVRRTTRIVTVHGIYETTENLNSIEKRLPALDFGRCHNSYIVYFPAVAMKRKDGFQMNNGDDVVISRQYQRKMQEAFLHWAKTQ